MKSTAIDIAKLNAAKRAIEHAEKCNIIGIGTGSTVEKFIEAISKLEEFKEKLYIASSFDTVLKLTELGFRVLDPMNVSTIDIYIDGADEVDPELNMIKGGGAALTTEKMLTFYSKKRVFIVDSRKIVRKLGERAPVPLDVLPRATNMVVRYLKDLGYKVEYRMAAKGRCGPVMSDVGGVILDLYTGPIENVKKLDLLLKSIPGIIEHGLFVELADIVIVGYVDKVEVLCRSK